MEVTNISYEFIIKWSGLRLASSVSRFGDAAHVPFSQQSLPPRGLCALSLRGVLKQRLRWELELQSRAAVDDQ
jgi:hypothetical protein